MQVSYASNFEDVLLWRALGHVSGGRYIDVGAGDPVLGSVSLAFYERGWRGIHVEPRAECARKLRESRPDETVIEAAVDAGKGVIALSGMAAGGTAGRQAADGARAIEVPCVTLDDVFARRGEGDIHWLRLDAEDREGRALAGWHDGAARPWVVVVRSNRRSMKEAAHEGWEPGLLDLGYRFALFDGLNRYYVANERTSLLPALSCGPGAFDDFALSDNPGNPFSTLLNARIRNLEERERAAAAESRADKKTILNLERDLFGARSALEDGSHHLARLQDVLGGFSGRAASVLKANTAGARDLAQLLELNDADFVRGAFRLLLQREADRTGLKHYLGLLRGGAGKADIIRRLRYSREGRKIGFDVSPLRWPLVLSRIAHAPVIGRVIRSIAGLFGFGQAERGRAIASVQQLETEWLRLQGILARHDSPRDAGGELPEPGPHSMNSDTASIYHSLRRAVRARSRD